MGSRAGEIDAARGPPGHGEQQRQQWSLDALALAVSPIVIGGA
ncbi:hypothetical protein MPS_1090 [Mycobacterium pseudoshottsii JCM 15466]|nr:hypothetical protein MPS_1090 [Mycobacterium pseudoshottsii JCM 15466]